MPTMINFELERGLERMKKFFGTVTVVRMNKKGRRRMTKVIVAVFMLVSWSGLFAQQHPLPATPAASQPVFTYNPTPEESELIDLSHKWMDLAAKKDEKLLREIMAEDFTLQIWDASRAPQPLEKWMDTLKNHLQIASLEFTAMSASRFGDVGVVYARYKWSGSMNDKPFNDSGFLADVWVRKNGRWKVVSRRSAPQQQIREVLKSDEKK